MTNIGEQIKKHRKEKGLSQKRLGEILNVSDVMISQWEKGVRNPKYDTLEKIANALQISVLDLMDIRSYLKYQEEYKNEILTKEHLDNFCKMLYYDFGFKVTPYVDNNGWWTIDVDEEILEKLNSTVNFPCVSTSFLHELMQETKHLIMTKMETLIKDYELYIKSLALRDADTPITPEMEKLLEMQADIFKNYHNKYLKE